MPNKILVVDDEPDLEVLVRQRFRSSIRSGQYEFLFAHNGVEALLKLREHFDIAVVLTDINMPQMDGLTLLGELEQLNHQPEHLVKAVVVSAYGDMDNIRTAMNRGAFDFLTKPIDFQDVEITIAKTLDYVHSLHESRRAKEYRLAKDVAEDNYSKLQELENLRDSLVHMIVHDLRTPLTSVLGGLQTVEAFGELNDGQREMMEMAISGGQTLLDMVNDLLTISKMENGALKITRREVQAGELVGRALEQVQFLAKGKNIELRIESVEALPSFSADDELICRVLVNLMGNAVKFTPGGGVIRLLARSDAEQCELVFTVDDNGYGIPETALASIFDKFGQVEGTSGTRTSTGLGLTFCKMAVEAHEGRIWVTSTPGQGSAFSFALPLAQPAATSVN